MQHALAGPRELGQGGGGRGRAQGHAVQHHRGERRHVDGHRGHVLLVAVTGSHRGFDRNGDPRAVVRRRHRHPGLRQEHARRDDGAVESGPALPHGLRRHYSGGADPERPGRGHRVRVPELRSVHRRQYRPGRTAGHRAQCLSGRRSLRRHVHREHHVFGDRGDGHVAALQLVHSGPGPRQARRVPARGGGGAAVAGNGSAPEPYHDSRGLRECDGDGDGARRLHQRGAASHRDGAGGRSAARARRLSRR